MKLYEQDPYISQFQAKVIERRTVNHHPAVVLNQTAFYPLGGGQEADRGTLNGVAVIDVIEQDETILHLLASELTGDIVDGVIDWKRRFDHMQQHTGEHILSGLVLQHHGAQNVGFHIGEDRMRVDYDQYLDWDQLALMERETNRIIAENRPVKSGIFQEGDNDYRFKKALTGDIRIVDVPGVDRCACCGTHVRSTAHVGIVKIVEAERYKGGVRLGVVCGDRAIEYFQKLQDQTRQLTQITSSQTFGLVPTIQKKYRDSETTERQLADLERRLVALLVEQTPEQPEPMILFEQLGTKATATLAAQLVEKVPWVAIFNLQDDGSYRYYFHAKAADMAEKSKQFLQRFPGKGGGKHQTAQGSVQANERELIEWMRSKS